MAFRNSRTSPRSGPSFCRNSGLSLGVALRTASLQMGYLKKGGDGSLLYSVVNAAEPDADGEWLCLGPFPSHLRVSLISAPGQ